MNYNKHSNLDGKHAILSASNNSWLNYDMEDPIKYYTRYTALYAKEAGTHMHKYAEDRIKYRMKLSKSSKNDVLFYLLTKGIPGNAIDINYYYPNLMAYVNDAISYRMDTEVTLYYSENCFGTADAISFRDNVLRIHDLKTGKSPVHIEQLLIYAALFCMEYKFNINAIKYDLRIYQGGEVLCHEPLPADIHDMCARIKAADDIIKEIKNGG